ncbi:MAG: GNAT family N-acetyltransferase [Deltaproteobacteria bacterium]|nr:GNAT family N-acetyltransferase [Deltaproteobacteria bacterium]
MSAKLQTITRRATLADLPAVLELQKLAFLSEAELLGDYNISPLKQTLPEKEAEWRKGLILVTQSPNGERIVGSVQAIEEKGRVLVGKLIVDPKWQNQGLATDLLKALEKIFGPTTYELHTSSKSLKNLHLYHKIGYQEVKRAPMTDSVDFVYLEKTI